MFKDVKDGDKFSVSALGSLQDDRVSSLKESPIVSVWRLFFGYSISPERCPLISLLGVVNLAACKTVL